MGRIRMKITCKNIYSVFRMIVLFLIITYFSACTFYYISSNFNSEEDVANGNTFVQRYGFTKENGDDWLYYLLSMFYYISTTVNIIGYGEMYPASNIEKCFIILIMFTGQFMAVYFVG
jgi:hypothetical protein